MFPKSEPPAKLQFPRRSVMKKILSVLFVLSFIPQSFAKIVIVVTPNRVESNEDQTATSTTVIDEQQIEESQKLTVAEMLETVPGLHVTSQGGLGKQTSVFLRGAKSEHTLVFIDGIEVNDPSSPTRGFDFANLSLDNVERIEVVRGTQSVLYGSDAIGGVIQIFTKKNKTETLQMNNVLSGGYGSFQTHQEGLQSSISNKKYSLSMGLSHLQTDGISSSDEDDNPGAEKDPYELTTIQSNISLTPSEKTQIDLFARYLTSENEIDDFGGAGGDDPNFHSRENDFYAGMHAKSRFGIYQPELSFSFAHIERNLNDEATTADPLVYTADFIGKNIKPSLLHQFFIDDHNSIVVGNDYEIEDFESTSNFGNSPNVDAYHFGSFAQYQFVSKYFHSAAGARLEKHQFFGTNLTYKISPGVNIPQSGTTLNFNYATGFKAPSLFQLYDTFSGNSNLDPDKVRSYDISLHQKIHESTSLGATYFNNKFEETIEYSFVTNTYQNIGESSSSGFEFSVQSSPISKINLLAQWTILNSEDASTGLRLLRRPDHRGEFDIQYKITSKFDVGGNYTFVGERLDIGATGNVDMPSYGIFGLRTSYQLNKHLQVLARVDNISNKNYQEVYGFGTPGINWFSSLKYNF